MSINSTNPFHPVGNSPGNYSPAKFKIKPSPLIIRMSAKKWLDKFSRPSLSSLVFHGRDTRQTHRDERKSGYMGVLRIPAVLAESLLPMTVLTGIYSRSGSGGTQRLSR